MQGSAESEAESASRAITMARLDMVATARAMLRGELSFIEGARRISSLRYRVGVEDFDEDMLPFVAIDSDTDTYPFGETRLLWNSEALAKLQPEIDRSEQWAREVGHEHCKNLVERFGTADVGKITSEAEFWARLRQQMNAKLRASHDKGIRFLWIDDFVPDTLLPKLEEGEVLVWAYVSEDSGKSFVEYRLRLCLNTSAVERYRSGAWSALLPTTDTSQWFALDRAAKEIDVVLCSDQ